MAEQVKRTIGNKSGPKIGAKKPEAAPAKEETTVEEPRKKGGVKKLILLGVAGLVFMGAGVGAAVLLLQPDAAPAAAAGEVAAEPVEHVELGEFARQFVAEYIQGHPLDNDTLDAKTPAIDEQWMQ